MSITVLNPGLLTTVQDMGRVGYQQFGVSVSGVMDPRSAAIANILVGNPEDEAVLECTMMGPQLLFNQAETIAITGGDLMATLDGQPMPTYRAVTCPGGSGAAFPGPQDRLPLLYRLHRRIGHPQVMGSRSTYMKAKIGGFQGRKLQKDDVIGFRAPGAPKNLNIRCMSPEFIPRPVYTLRVVMGPQDDAFTQQGLDTFLRETYSVTNEFDRMGCRLDGPVIQHVTDGNIISDGIAFGAIQVPSEGQAHHHAGRPSDHRRLHQDRQCHLCRLPAAGPAEGRRQGEV